MKISAGGAYDPETIILLRAALDAAWDTLSADQHSRTTKSELALRMLKLAAQGERDPIRLRTRAVIEVMPGRPRRERGGTESAARHPTQAGET
jgi:hypothetical protein